MTPRDFLTACATEATSDPTTIKRLTDSFEAMFTGGGMRIDGCNDTVIGIEHGPKNERRVSKVHRSSIVQNMTLCATLDLYPARTASPMTPPQFRGPSMEIGPNHRGWARLMKREGLMVQPIVAHVNDTVSLEDDRVRLRRDPSVRVSDARDLLGVVLYVKALDGSRVLDHWVPGDTVRKRAEKSRGFATKEWFSEFAAAASIRDAIARGALVAESAAIDAAMGQGEEIEPEAAEPKAAARPAVVPHDVDIDLPPALFGGEGDALTRWMKSNHVTDDMIDEYHAGWCRKPGTLSGGAPALRDGAAKYLGTPEGFLDWQEFLGSRAAAGGE